VIASGETLEGATRFRSGAGRHGEPDAWLRGGDAGAASIAQEDA
jgi:hypothetical protein